MPEMQGPATQGPKSQGQDSPGPGVQGPRRTRTYQSALIDSTRWDRYRPRDGDVVVATPYKSGTTWTLNLVRRLIFQGQRVPPYRELWLDATFGGELDELLAEIEGQDHRRYLKTHLALDGLPFYEQVRYVVVGRDPRDVFMSFANHYGSMTEEFYREINDRPGRVGPELPRYHGDLHRLWREWITQGTFDWEQEGYPWWGNLHHVRSWWAYRHLDNILFVHYNDLLADLEGEVRRIAAFLDIELDEAGLPAMLEALTLTSMRAEAVQRHGSKEHAARFFYKGTNGRWRDALTPEELALYDDTADRVLPPECRAWLEQGMQALS